MNKSCRSIGRLVLFGLVSLVIVVIAVFAVWRLRLAHDVERRLAALRAAGLPTSGAELNTWYAAVPDSENAALVMTQAFALARKFSDERSNWDANPSLDHREQWSEGTRKLVIEYLAMNAEALAKAREAVQRSQCRFPVDFSLGPEKLKLPQLAELKGLALKAASRASLAAEEGRSKDCVEDIRLMLELAATLDREPGIVSQKVRNAIIVIATLATERVLNLTGLDEASDDGLARAYAKAASTNSIQVALIGELATAIPFFRLNWTQDNNWPKAVTLILQFSGIFERDLKVYLSAAETNLALAALGPPRSLMMTNVVKQSEELRYSFPAGLLIALGSMAVNDTSTLARIRLAQSALAVERFCLAHGRLPEDFNELTPQFLSAVPTDPFDGAPLRYRRLAKGYLVYSVGSDGHDDGGRERPADWKSSDKATCDITFTVER